MKHLSIYLITALFGFTARAQTSDTMENAPQTPAPVETKSDILFVLNPLRFREGDSLMVAALRNAGYSVKTASEKELASRPFSTTLHSLPKSPTPSEFAVDAINSKVNIADHQIVIFGSHQNAQFSPYELTILKAALEAKKLVVAEVPGVKFGPDYITEQAAGAIDPTSWYKRFRAPSSPEDFPLLKAKGNIIIFNNLGAFSGGPLPKPADDISFCEKKLIPAIKKMRAQK